MKAEVELAILNLISKIDDKVRSEEALKFTQSALNLAHVCSTLDAIKNRNKE